MTRDQHRSLVTLEVYLPKSPSLAVLMCLFLSSPASAQSARIAAFGEVGFANIGADDSEQGNMVTYGGELVVRLRGALRAGIDVETGEMRTRFGSTFRQTSLTISALGEWPGRARVRGLAGGGVGWLFQRRQGLVLSDAGRLLLNPGPEDFVPFTSSGTERVLHARGGMVGAVSDHVHIRAEAIFSLGGGLFWVLGGRAAIGYKF